MGSGDDYGLLERPGPGDSPEPLPFTTPKPFSTSALPTVRRTGRRDPPWPFGATAAPATTRSRTPPDGARATPPPAPNHGVRGRGRRPRDAVAGFGLGENSLAAVLSGKSLRATHVPASMAEGAPGFPWTPARFRALPTGPHMSRGLPRQRGSHPRQGQLRDPLQESMPSSRPRQGASATGQRSRIAGRRRGGSRPAARAPRSPRLTIAGR